MVFFVQNTYDRPVQRPFSGASPGCAIGLVRVWARPSCRSGYGRLWPGTSKHGRSFTPGFCLLFGFGFFEAIHGVRFNEPCFYFWFETEKKNLPLDESVKVHNSGKRSGFAPADINIFGTCSPTSGPRPMVFSDIYSGITFRTPGIREGRYHPVRVPPRGTSSISSQGKRIHVQQTRVCVAVNYRQRGVDGFRRLMKSAREERDFNR